MAARAGMADLITRLRGMTDAGTADYSVASETYWDDDQLQDVLDGHRRDLKREGLMSSPDVVAGSQIEYHDYYFYSENAEGTASGTAAWTLADSTGVVVAGTAYTVNERAQQIHFTADTRGTAYVLSYRSYDVERAASEIWKTKAGHVASRFDLKTDNHDMKRSQLFTQYMQMSDHYRKQAKAQTRQLYRSDVNSAPNDQARLIRTHGKWSTPR